VNAQLLSVHEVICSVRRDNGRFTQNCDIQDEMTSWNTGLNASAAVSFLFADHVSCRDIHSSEKPFSWVSYLWKQSLKEIVGICLLTVIQYKEIQMKWKSKLKSNVTLQLFSFLASPSKYNRFWPTFKNSQIKWSLFLTRVSCRDILVLETNCTFSVCPQCR
jgi:hypothetical protein